MGITSGIILGTTLPYKLQQYFGWPVSFMSASIGMIIAFMVFTLGIKRYHLEDYHPRQFKLTKLLQALILIALLWCISFSALYYPFLADILFGIVAFLAVLYMIYTINYETAKQARQTTIIALLCIISIIFWAFYFQMYMSLTLFIARVVNPTLFGISFPAPYYVSIQSLGLILFGLLISYKKNQSNPKQNGRSTGNKFLLSMVFMCLSYGLITFASYSNTGSLLLSPLLLIPAYLFISVAELLLSPVGLASITVLASRHRVSTMMGIFFVTLGLGGFLSGKLASITAIDSSITQLAEIKQHYAQTFGYLLLILLGSTVFCFILNFFIKKLSSDNKLEAI